MKAQRNPMTHAVHARYVAGYTMAASAGKITAVNVEHFYVQRLSHIVSAVDHMDASIAQTLRMKRGIC
jgi:hypothetical protein